jgi:hypothetical protein
MMKPAMPTSLSPLSLGRRRRRRRRRRRIGAD